MGNKIPFIHPFILCFTEESEKSKESVAAVMKERDQALEDIRGVEASYFELHRRYEKSKQIVDGFKKVNMYRCL